MAHLERDAHLSHSFRNKRANKVGKQWGQSKWKAVFLSHVGVNITKQNAYFINKLICHSPRLVGVQRQQTGLWKQFSQNWKAIRLRLICLKLEWNQSWIWGLHCNHKTQKIIIIFHSLIVWWWGLKSNVYSGCQDCGMLFCLVFVRMKDPTWHYHFAWLGKAVQTYQN